MACPVRTRQLFCLFVGGRRKKKTVFRRRHLVAVIKILGFVNRPLDAAAFVAAVASVAAVFVAVAVVVVVGVREDDILRF
jgi:hypothetical protein